MISVAVAMGGLDLPDAVERRSADAERILIVDDQPEIRGILRVILRGMGFFVETAADGMQALQTILDPDRSERERVGTLLTDLQMPGMDGASLIRTLKEEYGWTGRIFAMSGDGSSDEARFVRALGIPLLEKPFSAERMQQLLAS